MIYWNELRTALIVARLGTVSAAASELGVHRATVHRHINLLEGAPSAKLFQRHARGYILTDDGREMLDVASRADEMFADLEGKTRKSAGRLSGELVLTAVAGVASLLMPAIKTMREVHPEISIELVADDKMRRLEYGEAHIAFRAGAKPTYLDYVVRRFCRIQFGLYASNDYVTRFGFPKDGNFDGHKFIGAAGDLFPRQYAKWLGENVTADQVALKTGSRVCIHEAVVAGLGLGFMAEYDAEDYPDLVEVISPSREISCDLWIVTHVDLHRSAKVQAFLNVLRQQPQTLKRAS